MRVLTLLVLITGASQTQAHELARELPWTWDTGAWAILCLAAPSAAYVAGVLRWKREGRWPDAAIVHAAAFLTGIALLVIALLSPLDSWADELFTAHMGQHLILMMAAPPLLVFGRPVVTMLWALPRNARHAAGRYWARSRAVRPLIDTLTSPLLVWIAASVALWFWHLPKPYDWAFHSPALHIAEHLSFFVTSILFWRVVLDDSGARRLSYAATMVFVATFAIENGMLGAILTFANRVLYAPYASQSAWSALSPLEDQQLAGILMWFSTGLIDLIALGALFMAWLASAERRSARA